MDFLKDCIPSRWILVLMVLLVAILAPRKGWAQALVLAPCAQLAQQTLS